LATTYYLEIEGYAGVGCRFTAVLTPPAGVCTLLPLPVQLTSFTAKVNRENQVNLNWITATEENNDYFTVEKSKDGVNFEFVAAVAGAGNSSAANFYEFVDDNPYNGTSYYRLMQTDYNGETSFSELNAVNIKGTYEDVLVYPNPVAGIGYISFNSSSDESTKVYIMDVAGRIVLGKEFVSTKGLNKIVLNTSGLTTGMYFLTLGSEDEMTRVKFVKE